MIIDSTFWVAVSFFIFIGVLIYFKVHEKINSALNENIKSIKSEVNSAEDLSIKHLSFHRFKLYKLRL